MRKLQIITRGYFLSLKFEKKKMNVDEKILREILRGKIL